MSAKDKDAERRAPDYEPQLTAAAKAEAEGRLPKTDRRDESLLPEETEPPKVREIDNLDPNVPILFHETGDPATDKKLYVTIIRWLLLQIRAREGAVVAEIDYWLEHIDDIDLAPPARSTERKTA